MKQVFLLILLSLSLGFTALAQTSTASTPTVSPTPKPKKVVFRATKDQVIAVQTKLKEANLYTGEIDGKSNTAFKTSVKSWQKENGLTANGSLNRATLEKMGIELTDKQMLIPAGASSYAKPNEPKPAEPKGTVATGDGPKRPAPFRANKDQIEAAQKILRDGKMLTGGEDGKLDDATRAALKEYQAANGLKVSETGALNAATLEKMGIALTDAQKTQVAAQAAYDAARPPKN